MRSRYAAYALEKVSYVMETSAERRDDEEAWAAEIRAFCRAVDFVSLTIHAHEVEGAEGMVWFTAGLMADGRDVSFTERSRFLLTDRWRYVDGERTSAP